MKIFNVVVRATVTKTLTVVAEDEDSAVQTAHQEFTTECDGDEDYQEDVLDVLDVGELK